jgi:K+ transporter
MIELTDVLLTISSVGFTLSLLPAIRDSLRGRTTITLLSSVPTALLLCLTAAALFMLGQVISPAVTLLSAVCWAFLALRRWWEGS